MYVKKGFATLLTMILAVAFFTACGRWDYSREAVKAANDAQGETLRVEFKVSQAFTDALRGAVADNIQPADVEKAITMDKTAEKLLTSGYRLDVYALRADIDADQAAAQLAGEFIARLAGCEDEGFISMVKADNGYFYEAVLAYKHSSGSDSSSDEPDGSGDNTPVQKTVIWNPESGSLTFLPGASETMGSTVLNTENVKHALVVQGDLKEEDDFFLYNVVNFEVQSGSGVTEIGETAFNYSAKLNSINLSGVETIDTWAFQCCKALDEVNLSGVRKINRGAFNKCSSILSLDLTNIEELELEAFAHCSGLENVTLKGVKKIGNHAFNSCHKLTSVDLPDVEYIYGYAFGTCYNLVDVYIGDALSDMQAYVFYRTPIDITDPNGKDESKKRPLRIHYGNDKDDFISDAMDGTITIYNALFDPFEPNTEQSVLDFLGSSVGRAEIVFLPYSSST